MIFQHSQAIRASAESAYRFFASIDENYTRWHPAHESCRWLGDDRLAEGSRLEFTETIGGHRMTKQCFIRTVVPDSLIVCSMTNRFYRLFIPFWSFTFETTDDGIVFIQKLKVRMGPIGKWLNRKGLQAVERHIVEEGENLKAILEAVA